MKKHVILIIMISAVSVIMLTEMPYEVIGLLMLIPVAYYAEKGVVD